MQKRTVSELLVHERELWKQYSRVAGLDEAGRGAWAGPVVAAAAVFAPGVTIPGVDDSKKLTPKKREELYGKILATCSGYGVGIVDSVTVDRINILEATKQAMLIAISQISPAPDFLIIDGNMAIASNLPQYSIIDGDALSFTIAAASILAKVSRDRIMVELCSRYPGYGFARHKGYGTKDHQEALCLRGITPIHRVSYRPVAAITATATVHRSEGIGRQIRIGE